MNTLIRKSFLFFIAGIISFQFAFFSPQRAQAGSMDSIKSILIQIESIVPNSPLPISIGEFFALLDLIEMCKDTSDAGLMACLDGASANPTIGPLLESGKGNLETALKIYIDIKNQDYVQLMIDGGKPIGCAAANIFTGVDICGLLEELAALAGAVGEALEYAASWLEDLDVALFGQTPHMNEGMYYQERWRPYLKDYAEKRLKGGVTDDTALSPHLNKSAFNYGGTYAEFGLDIRSLNSVYMKCLDYYTSFKDDNATKFCNNNRNLFKTKIDLIVKQAQAINAFTVLLEPSIKNQSDAWKLKVDNMLNDLDAKWPGKGVKDASKYPTWMWPNSIDSYKANVTKKMGYALGSEFCLNGDYWECIDLPKSVGSLYSFAFHAYESFYDSKFQGDAADILTSSLDEVKPQLQSSFDALKKNFESYWEDKQFQESYSLIGDVALPAKENLWKLQGTCKTLKQDMAGEKYSALCLKSEPLNSCFKTIESIWEENPYEMSQSQLKTFLADKKVGIDACVTASTKVVNEWVRMDNLKKPYLDGWSKFYADSFPSYHNTAETKNDVPKPAYELQFQLGVAYNNCVVLNMKKTESDVLSTSGSAIQGVVGKSASELMNTSGISKIAITKIEADKPGGIVNQPANKIAEGFCYSDGLSVADPKKAKTDPFGGGVAPPQPPNDPASRSHLDNNKAQSVGKKSGCTPYQWTADSKLNTDPFHMVCDSKEKYNICFEALGGKVRASYAHCTAAYGHSIDSSYVDKPCCAKNYEDPLLGAKLKGSVDADVKINSKDVIESANKGLFVGKVDNKDDDKRVSNKFRAVKDAASIKVTPSVVGTGGSVEPNTAQTIKVGERAKFKLKPNLGYKVKSVTGCGVAGDVKNEFETGAVVTDCSLQITFESSKIQFMNNGGRTQSQPGTPTLDKRTLPAGRPMINQPLQRKTIPLPPMPPIQEKK